MHADRRNLADRRLEAGFAECGLADSRATYRALLRDLRERDAASFERATHHYQEHVLPRLAGDDDAIEAWIDYGRVIGELVTPGRMMRIDASGRASGYAAPLGSGEMALWVPDDGTRGSFVAVAPVTSSAAQLATISLLVEGKLSL
jgi:hypothetical protein